MGFMIDLKQGWLLYYWAPVYVQGEYDKENNIQLKHFASDTVVLLGHGNFYLCLIII